MINSSSGSSGFKSTQSIFPKKSNCPELHGTSFSISTPSIKYPPKFLHPFLSEQSGNAQNCLKNKNTFLQISSFWLSIILRASGLLENPERSLASSKEE